MSTYTVVTFTGIERTLGDAEVSALIDPLEPSMVLAHNAVTRPDGTTVPAHVSVTWDDHRWSVEGLYQALPEISKRLDCEVEMVEEWDTQDADEQGSQGWRWTRGKLTATGRTAFTWTEATR